MASGVDPAVLRKAREEAGLTQHELARLVGAAGGERVSRWELGTSVPRPEFILKLAGALDIRALRLIHFEGDVPDLKALRLQAGLTVPRLTAGTNIAAPTYYSWEEGRWIRLPAPATLEDRIQQLGAHNLAAMIGEPIMGVAGLITPPPDYWRRIREVLTRHGILLIADEVVTGFGRTGEWFAAPDLCMQPDIIVTAKGITSGYLPLGAVLFSGPIADVLRSGAKGFPVGFTYFGHPVACAIALKNIEILEQENLLDAARNTGRLLHDLAAPLADLSIVGEIRQAGMTLALELVTDQVTRTPFPDAGVAIGRRLRDEFGVLVRVSAGSSLVLSPPFVLTENEATRLIDSIGSLLHQITSSRPPV